MITKEQKKRQQFIMKRASEMLLAKEKYSKEWPDYEKAFRMAMSSREGEDAWRADLPDTWNFATIKTAQAAFVDSKVIPTIIRHRDDPSSKASDLKDLYVDISEKGNQDQELYYTRLDAFKLGNGFTKTIYFKVGLIHTIPKDFSPASDVANLSILGYDPIEYYSGRGPLEAANMGIVLGPDDIAFRCNVVTIDQEKMVDYSAGHISSEEASTLIKFLDKNLGSDKVRFYPGVSYRHLMVVRDKPLREALLKIKCFPPHDIMGLRIKEHLPKGEGSEFLIKLMEDSKPLLAGHEINRV